MIQNRRDERSGNRTTAPWSVLWNTVVPALGIALLLGAPMFPAIAVAVAASVAITAVLAVPAWPGGRRTFS